MFIVIDGVDGSGKATQSRILADRLRAQLHSFPRYDTPVGKLILHHLKGAVFLSEHTQGPHHVPIRAPGDALAFQALMLADKCVAAKQINNDLAQGCPVVCDRWIPSSLCYGAADGLDPALLRDMHIVLPKADLNIFIDVSVAETLRRRPEVRDRYEQDRVKQQAVREQYEALWASGGPTYVKVNGEGSEEGMGPIESVAARIWKAVQTKFGVIEGGARK